MVKKHSTLKNFLLLVALFALSWLLFFGVIYLGVKLVAFFLSFFSHSQ